MEQPLRIAMLSDKRLEQLMASAPPSAADRAAATPVAATPVGALRHWLRRRGARGLGWRGRLPEPTTLARLRRAGVVIAAIGSVAELAPERLAIWAADGPLLAVIDHTSRTESLTDWWGDVAALRLPTLRIALADLAPCQVGSTSGDLAVTLLWPPRARSHMSACQLCAAHDYCAGVPTGVDVRPLALPVSNQFDFVEQVRAKMSPSPSSSPSADLSPLLRDGVPTLAVARHLLLQDGDVLRHYYCDNDGWTNAEIAHVTNTLGQAWLDASRKSRLDDFAEDLGPLRKVDDPVRLATGQWYPAVWRRVATDPFGRDEVQLRGRIATARGWVVDIGAGPIRYLHTLAGAIKSGDVRYVAVEPDLVELKHMAAALPGALMVQGVGEHLPIASGSVDHLFMLRSFNHLRDVAAAFAEASRVARSGATLLVVDNVAFGLLRSSDQIQRARAISTTETPFEHYRNANADAAVSAIEATGAWIVESVEAVAPGRANQWLVSATRI